MSQIRIVQLTGIVALVVAVVTVAILGVLLFRAEQRFDTLMQRVSESDITRFADGKGVIAGSVGRTSRSSDRRAKREAELARLRGIGLEEFRRREAEDEDRREEKEEEEEEESLGTQFGIPGPSKEVITVTVALDSRVSGAIGEVELQLNKEMDTPVLVASALFNGLSPNTDHSLCLADLLIATGKSNGQQAGLYFENAVIFRRNDLSGMPVLVFEGLDCLGEPVLRAVMPQISQ